MVVLTPNNFRNVPEYLRPKTAFVADTDFAKKVRHIKKYSTHSDEEEVGDVVTVLQNMKQIKPQMFRRSRRKVPGTRRQRTRGHRGVKKQSRRLRR